MGLVSMIIDSEERSKLLIGRLSNVVVGKIDTVAVQRSQGVLHDKHGLENVYLACDRAKLRVKRMTSTFEEKNVTSNPSKNRDSHFFEIAQVY